MRIPLLLRASARLGPIPAIDAMGVLRLIAFMESAMDAPLAIANIQSETPGESKILNPSPTFFRGRGRGARLSLRGCATIVPRG